MDRATPNLPALDFAATSAFYRRIGFVEGWRDGEWMILERGGLTLEFFLHPALDPAASWFSCCLRLDDVDAFFDVCAAAAIPESRTGWPRLHRPQTKASGLRVGALIDPNGTLIRLVQNPQPRG